MAWIDQHCHVPVGPTGDELVAAAAAADVVGMITVGCDLESSLQAITVAERHESVWASVGVHPHEASGGVDGVEALLDRPGVVAIGECGLDYHYLHSPADAQRTVFARHIAWAHERDLPLIIHTREAWDDTFDVLAAEGVPRRTVFHCFTGGVDEARRCLDLGAWLSFSGIVTFKKAGEVADAAAFCPEDRLMVETDAPYLTPVPHRGVPNQPAFVPLVGQRVAELRGVSAESLGDATVATTRAFYGLDTMP